MSDAIIQQNEAVWKPVPTFPGYECSSGGRLRNAKNQRELTPVKTRDSLVFCVRRDNRQAQISCDRVFKLTFPDRIEKVNCNTCGNEVTGEEFEKYCSKECKKQMLRWQRNASYSKGYKEGKYKRAYEPRVTPVRSCICIHCKTCFEHQSKVSRKYCSPECKRTYSLQAIPKKVRSLTCAVCSVSFIQKGRGATLSACINCSPEHSRVRNADYVRRLRRAGAIPGSRAIERARFYGVKYEHVNPFDVFRRDGWKCMLCSVPLDSKKRGTFDDDAPEIDHIIPISKGGDHVFDNLQSACRRCNLDKSDKM